MWCSHETRRYSQFTCFKRSALEMETLAFVLSKDLTKGDIQCRSRVDTETVR